MFTRWIVFVLFFGGRGDGSLCEPFGQSPKHCRRQLAAPPRTQKSPPLFKRTDFDYNPMNYAMARLQTRVTTNPSTMSSAMNRHIKRTNFPCFMA